MAGCQKKKRGRVDWGLWQGGELFKACCRTGNFPVWRCQGCKYRHIYSPPEGKEEEEEVILSLSAAIASSELHERKD